MSTSHIREERPRELKERWNTLFLGAVMVWAMIGFGILCMQPKQTTFLSRAMTVMEMVGDQDVMKGDAGGDTDTLLFADEADQVRLK